MLTKEQCEKALSDIKMANEYPVSKYNDSRLIDHHLITFKQLIYEHFDNPPLKFEELKEGDWIYDNNWGEYFEISEVYPKTNEFDILIHQNAINKRRYETIKFEENRFYRREVKE